MSKVPCGGFKLDNNFLGMNENDELSLVGGGGECKAYQQLMTDGDGNAKWATVNSVIFRGSDGNLSVEEYMEIDGYPASIEEMMEYGSILLIDDENGAIVPCISAFDSGSGYFILTFMLVGESSTKLIKIKVVGDNLVNGEISIITTSA